MGERRLRIVQVSTADALGGAERVAWNLFDAYRAYGHESHLAVGRKHSNDPDVTALRQDRAGHAWRRLWWGLHRRLQPAYGRMPGARGLLRLAQRLAEPGGWVDTLRGIEDFHFPAAWSLPGLFGQPPDVLHCHNLHGKYFDLRALPTLSRRFPTILTLHDAWMISGHCAHSFDCDRWKSGCGACPDLSIYPAIRRDATTLNWRRKQAIYQQCRFYIATPSQWLMDRVAQSMLAPAILEARVIPNGVDLSVFRPGDRVEARRRLGIPREARVLLFAAAGIRRNMWKDFETMRKAVAGVAESDAAHDEAPLRFIALGDDAPTERIGRAEITFVPHVSEPGRVAAYYQAADVYVHAARADTFPNTVIEALACGTPVVATAVGGIPEQVRGLDGNDERATGLLVSAGDACGLARGIERLLGDDLLRARLGENAARDARMRFDLRRQVDEYLAWYAELVTGDIHSASWTHGESSTHKRSRQSNARPRTGVRDSDLPAIACAATSSAAGGNGGSRANEHPDGM